MIELKYIIVISSITSILFFSPILAYSDIYSNMIISTNNSPYDVSLQYQIRDASKNLVCVVESTKISYYDSIVTREYLDSHPNHIIIEKDGQLVNYVLIKDSWTQGQGDSFLSALKLMMEDYERGKLFSLLFATTNGCAVEPGDLVTVYWKIFYT
jgi:hypothetical protein